MEGNETHTSASQGSKINEDQRSCDGPGGSIAKLLPGGFTTVAAVAKKTDE